MPIRSVRGGFVSKSVHRPIVLIVRDGWGANPDPKWNHANAIHLARTPVDDRLLAAYPHVQIHTSGHSVGLPDGVMGNSEVGHQNIGAGRIVEQEVMRITGRICDGSFFANPALVGAFDRAAETGSAVHIMGLCSDGRVHSDLDHLYGLLEMSRRLGFPGDRVFIHAFMDGRDTPPHAGIEYLEQIEAKCREFGTNPVASVAGRFYAMDRDNRWDRVQKAYDMLVCRSDVTPYPCFDSARAGVAHFYENPAGDSMKGDEFVTPSATCGSDGHAGRIRRGDSVIFFNFRGDRPRELTKAFTCDEFPFEDTRTAKTISTRTAVRSGFDRGPKLDLRFVTMTAYETGLPVTVAFDKPPPMPDLLGSYLAEKGCRQFRCAETEKFPHVTFFFNGYRDEPFPGQEQALVPSPRDVNTYDQKPEMSAHEVTELVLERIADHNDDLIVLNYANGDMVGHTGSLPAAIRAVETVDKCVGRVVDTAIARDGGLIVTADHGNCEQMIDPDTGGPHTAHTTYDVELTVVDQRYRGRTLRPGGGLADVAPTLLEMLDLPTPGAMTGSSLILPA